MERDSMNTMITLIATLGSSITLFGLMWFYSPNGDPASLAIQFTIIIAPALLIAVLIFLSITSYFTQFTNRMKHPINVFTSTVVMLAFFALPNGKRLLLNDFVFTIACVLTVWCWLSWGFFMRDRFSVELKRDLR